MKYQIDELQTDVERLTAERDGAFAEMRRLRSLLDDKQYIQTKADYNRGHLSHAGWLEAREKRSVT